MSGLTTLSAMQLAFQHHNAGRLREAEELYRRVLEAEPNNANALHLLGVLMFETNRSDAAIQLIQRAIAANPNVLEYHWNLARILAGRGLREQAIVAFRRALVCDPANADIWNDLGNSLQLSGQLPQAIAAYHNALTHNPRHADALNNLGNALRDSGQIEEAIAQLRLAIQHRPNFPEAYNNLGNALLAASRFDESIASYQQALTQRPDYAQAYNNLGGALRWAGRLDDAIASFNRAIALNSDSCDPYNNMGITLIDKMEVPQAIGQLRRAIEMRPDYAEAHHNLGMALLLNGEFEQGWAEYEWRWRVREMSSTHQPLNVPRWQGEPLEGKRLFLHAEQGFGDTIQFVRYVPLAAERGGKIILACQPEMARLFKSVQGVDEMVVEGSVLPKIDLHCPLASLPLVFKTDLQTIPATVPYLRVDEEISSRWRERLAEFSGKLKVGLAWASRPRHKLTRHKSIELSMLAPLAQLQDIKYFSLQKGEAAHQPAPAGLEFVDWNEELNDFAETGGLIDNLDIVVTVDTAVAHLAGAMGKTVWMMLPFSGDWRWLIDRTDSPWYPTMRLFRQPAIGDWQSVIEQIAAELSCLSK